MKLYLAGPMSGLPNFNYDAFHRYAKLLRERGYEVFNPAEAHNGDQGLELWQYYASDLPEVAKADAVAVLPGWSESTGARIEVLVAKKLGKPVYSAVLLVSNDVNHESEALITDDVDVVVIYPNPDNGPDFERVYDDSELTTSDRFEFYESNPERHTSVHGGVKDNVNKPRLDLIPSLPLFKAGEVLAFGARKYKPHNWRLGLSWLETYGSLQRHLAAWLDGEDNDRESGYHHLAHAVCQMLFLAEFVFRGTGTDDRFVSLDRTEAMTDDAAARLEAMTEIAESAP